MFRKCSVCVDGKRQLMMSALMYLLLLVSIAECVDITKCCVGVSSVDLGQLSCRSLQSPQPSFKEYRPKVFSLESEAYVNEALQVTSTGIPQCQEGEVITHISLVGDDDEQFVLLSGEKTLFVTKDSSTHSNFCVDEVQSSGITVGSIALYCGPDPGLVCSTKYCVSTCCPQEMVMDKRYGHCAYREGYKLEPQFVDKSHNPVTIINRDDYFLFHGEPNCKAHSYESNNGSKPSEFQLLDDGLLHIGHHEFNHSQYCLEEVYDAAGLVGMTAKVCDIMPDNHREVLAIMSNHIIPALLIISEVFLLLTFILHVIVPEFRKQMFGWMKMCTVGSLFLGYQMLIIVILGSNVLMEEYLVICQTLGFLIQYFFLSAFCWMSSMSFEVWSTFRQLSGSAHSDIRLRSQKKRFYYFNLYSWGLPWLVTMVTLIIHLLPEDETLSIVTPGFGDDTCFFHSYPAHLAYFHGIIAAILVINLVFFILSAYALLFGIWAPSRDSDNGTQHKTRAMFGIVVELFLVMGLTWSADVVSLVINWNYGQAYAGWEIVIFDIINSLQGFLIFIVLICKPRMRGIIRASLSPALTCFTHKSFDTVDSPDTTGKSTASPRTKTSVIFESCSPERNTNLVTKTQKELIEELSNKPARCSNLFDNLTPSWKRGSYNLAFYHSQDDLGLSQATLNITALSCTTESKC